MMGGIQTGIGAIATAMGQPEIGAPMMANGIKGISMPQAGQGGGMPSMGGSGMPGMSMLGGGQQQQPPPPQAPPLQQKPTVMPAPLQPMPAPPQPPTIPGMRPPWMSMGGSGY